MKVFVTNGCGSFGITDAETDSSGVVVLDFRVVDFLDYTFRLRLCRSVENLLLTSSLALLDSTLPKIRQNDGKGVVILRL